MTTKKNGEHLRAPTAAPRLPKRDTAGAPLLTLPRATAAAARVLDSFRADSMWTMALSGGSLGVPLLVERVDRSDSYYYIVPVLVGARETARIRLDAKTGDFLELAGIKRASQQLLRYMSVTQVVERLNTKRIAVPGGSRRYVRKGMVGQHPVLVWKLCRQSPSPYQPFYLLTIGDTPLYIRVDGKQYMHLTAE